MRHILIVDDEKFLVNNLSELVSVTQEWEPSIAYNAKEAIEIFSNSHFDVLLLDLCLPDMEGIELAQVLSKLDPEVRIIYMSAYPEYLKKVKTPQGSDELVLEKPFDFSRLHNILKTIN